MAEENQEDLSMEDILSSIRNILVEDNAEQQAKIESAPEAVEEDEPLNLETVVSDEPLDLSPVLEDIELPQDDEALVLDTSVEDDMPVEDVLNLSKSMIIDDEPLPETSLVAAPEPVAELPEPVEELLLTEDDIDFTAGLAGLADETSADGEEKIPVSGLDEVAPAAVDEDPTDSAMLAAEAHNIIDVPYEEEVEEFEAPVAEIQENEVLPEADDNAEPIFSPEEDNLVDFNINEAVEEENLVDDDTLNEILNIHAQTMPVEDEPTSLAAEIPHAVPEAEKPQAPYQREPEPMKPQAPVAPQPATSHPAPEAAVSVASEDEGLVKEDAVDLSASIINNFAKMFAEKQEENQPAAAPVFPETQTEVDIAMPDKMPIGNGALTLEDIVKQTVRSVVEKNLQSINQIATQEISRQTKAWLDANLPKMVEAVVKQEIERVMVKVGR